MARVICRRCTIGYEVVPIYRQRVTVARCPECGCRFGYITNDAAGHVTAMLLVAADVAAMERVGRAKPVLR